MFELRMYCDRGHVVIGYVDEDGLVLQPEHCTTCAVASRPSKFVLWRESRKARRALAEGSIVERLMAYDSEDE